MSRQATPERMCKQGLTDCIMNKKGYCAALEDTTFRNKVCPFYLTWEMAAERYGEYDFILDDMRRRYGKSKTK